MRVTVSELDCRDNGGTLPGDVTKVKLVILANVALSKEQASEKEYE